MCTMVKTKDLIVLLDAGVALGPRFGLMPHPREYKAMDEARKRIEEAARQAKVVTISHYHNDHHTPNFVDPVWLGTGPESLERIYRTKTILAKESRRMINTAQRRRGWMFRQAAEKVAEKIHMADGQSYQFGRTTIRFPGPVPHGEDESGLGWVLPCVIDRSKERVMFAPDVQGPVVEETLQLILSEKPDLLIIGGPPTYLKGFRIGDEFFVTALRNLQRLSENIETVVVDHHLLRDEGWLEYLSPVRKSGRKAGHKIVTAAALLGKEPKPLEGSRRSLYENDKPSSEFLDWTKLPKEKQSVTPPPLGISD